MIWEGVRPASLRVLLTILLLPVLTCGDGSDTSTEPPATGAIEVNVETTGSDPDDDGYRVYLDESKSSFVHSNGTIRFDGVSPGEHALELRENAANCTSSDGLHRSVTVQAGVSTSISLALECPPLSVVRIAVQTIGDEPDADGYTIIVDGEEIAIAPTQVTIEVGGLHSGRRLVTIGGIAGNCRAALPTQAATEVLLEPAGIADVSFTIFCLAPDAGRLTFVHTESSLRIATMPAIGGEADVLTSIQASAPAVSLDGRRVAFSSLADIFVMNANGSSLRKVTNTPRLETAPAWSPDGTRLAYMVATSATNEFFDIFVSNADGTGEVKITDAPEFGGWDPAWSPDGDRIVVRTYTDDWGGGNLWLMDASGANRIQLTTEGWHDGEPEWSPDGTQIVFARQLGPNNNFDVFVVNADGTGLTQLTNDGGPSNAASWSPDGRWIAFASRRWSGSPKFQIHVMRSDGTDVVRLTSTGADQPFWAPDP